MSTRRGYRVTDARDFSVEEMPKLTIASKHIQYLIDEGYKMKSASVFVGNHFLLSQRQRTAITRTLCTSKDLETRKAKEIHSIRNKKIYIDGFNIIITLEVYLSNAVLLVCRDGCIRDLAGLRGTYHPIAETPRAISLVFEYLQHHEPQAVTIYLDAPVSNSGRLKTLLAEVNDHYQIPLDIQIIDHVDSELKTKENIISTDSIILNECLSWFNLNKHLCTNMKRGLKL